MSALLKDMIDRMFPVDAQDLADGIDRLRAIRDHGAMVPIPANMAKAILNALVRYEADQQKGGAS